MSQSGSATSGIIAPTSPKKFISLGLEHSTAQVLCWMACGAAKQVDQDLQLTEYNYAFFNET